MDTNDHNLSDPLSWDQLADLYDERTGGAARTRPMDEVFEWGKRQDDLVVHPENGTIHYTLVTKEAAFNEAAQKVAKYRNEV